MVFGELTEGAMNDWSALYLRDVAHAATELTPLGIATVSAMMVLARVFADQWRARWGDRRVMLAGTALAAAGLGGALLAGGWLPALAGFACVGFGMAAVTPCIYVAAAKAGSNALALVASAGTAGLLVGPPVIGFVAGASSLVWGLTVVVAAIVVIFLSTTRISFGARRAASVEESRPHRSRIPGRVGRGVPGRRGRAGRGGPPGRLTSGLPPNAATGSPRTDLVLFRRAQRDRVVLGQQLPEALGDRLQQLGAAIGRFRSDPLPRGAGQAVGDIFHFLVRRTPGIGGGPVRAQPPAVRQPLGGRPPLVVGPAAGRLRRGPQPAALDRVPQDQRPAAVEAADEQGGHMAVAAVLAQDRGGLPEAAERVLGPGEGGVGGAQHPAGRLDRAGGGLEQVGRLVDLDARR